MNDVEFIQKLIK